MSLPKEIRQRIISEALSVDNNTHLMKWVKGVMCYDWEEDDFGLMEWKTGMALPLFQINKQVGSEAMECFQMENTPIAIISDSHEDNFVETFIQKVIPTKRILPSEMPPIALLMDLQFHSSHPRKWEAENPFQMSSPNQPYVRETELTMMAARHLPMLVKLINSTFSSPLTDNSDEITGNRVRNYPLYRIVLNFNDEVGKGKLGRLADSLKGLREFRFRYKWIDHSFGDDDPYRKEVKTFERGMVIHGLDPDKTKELLESSNLPILNVEDALEEVKDLIETADKLAAGGYYYGARSNYLIAVNTLRYEVIPDGNKDLYGLDMDHIIIHFQLPEHASVILSCWRKLARLALEYGRKEECGRFRNAIAGALDGLDREKQGRYIKFVSINYERMVIFQEVVSALLRHQENSLLKQAAKIGEKYLEMHEFREYYEEVFGTSDLDNYEDFFQPEIFEP